MSIDRSKFLNEIRQDYCREWNKELQECAIYANLGVLLHSMILFWSDCNCLDSEKRRKQ